MKSSVRGTETGKGLKKINGYYLRINVDKLARVIGICQFLLSLMHCFGRRTNAFSRRCWHEAQGFLRRCWYEAQGLKPGYQQPD